jgi:23S rRNA pseudouridine1911/1915/1917 synthase
MSLDILYEDEHCLVVNKPPGLSTQAPRGIDSLEVQVRALLQSRVNADMAYWQCDPSGQAPAVYLGLPHRLDRPVSGVIVLAKTKKGARKISRQFERRLVRKTYWAAVERHVEPAEGTWADWLRKIPGEARVEIVMEGHPEAQRADGRYLGRGSRSSRRLDGCIKFAYRLHRAAGRFWATLSTGVELHSERKMRTSENGQSGCMRGR